MQRPGAYLYALPLFVQARRSIWQAVNARTGRTRIDDAIPDSIVKRKDDKSMLVEFKNGSTLQLVGSDQPDSLVGAGVVGYVESESALSNPAAMALISPMLLETAGFSWHISSPRGRNGFYKMLEAHKNNPRSFTTVLSAYDTEVFTAAQLKLERHKYIQTHGVAMGNALFASEYEASFDAAIIGGVFTAELAKLRADARYGPCGYDPRYPVDTSCDVGVADDTVFCFWQNVGTETRLIDVYSSNDNGLQHYVQMLADKGYVYGTHYCPHDGAVREFGLGISRIEQAARLGLKWSLVPAAAKNDQIALGCQLMNRLIVNSTPDLDTGEGACEYAMEMLTQYHYKWDETRKVSSNQPVHDYSSHFCDAFMLYAVAKAKDTGFARPAGNQILMQSEYSTDRMRVSDIMRARSATKTSLWG
jgi:hypothetical protein